MLLLLSGGLGAAQPSRGARALLQLGSKVSVSDRLRKKPRGAGTQPERSKARGTRSVWPQLPWLCPVSSQVSQCHGSRPCSWGLQCSCWQGQPQPGPRSPRVMQETPLHFASMANRSWQQTQGGSWGPGWERRSRGGQGWQHARHTHAPCDTMNVNARHTALTALGKGFAQGACLGASAPLSGIPVAVFIGLLLRLSVSRSFYPAQRAGALGCFCHPSTRCFNP